MKKKKWTPFYVLYKNFNSKKVEKYNVMVSLYNTIFNTNGSISKSRFYIIDDDYKRKEIKNKQDLKQFIDRHFRYLYWAKCEWEFIVREWPTCSEEHDEKIDVYTQLKPNIDLIVDIVWEQIKDKILN